MTDMTEHPSSNRDRQADIFKGIGIVLMLIGHVGLWGQLSYWLHAFHMPMFFFISGFLYKEKEISISVQIMNKVKSLLMPYLVSGLLLFGCECIRSMLWNNTMPYRQGLNLLWENTSNVPVGGIWFLTALFITNVVFILLKKLIKNEAVLGVLCIAIGLLGMEAATFLPIRLPWAMDAGLTGISFFYVGYLIKKSKNQRYKEYVLNLPGWMLFLIAILNCIMIFLNDEINMRTGNYSNWLLFLFNAILGCLIIFNVARLINSNMNGGVATLLNNIGRHSLLYVCFNQLVIVLFTDMFGKVFHWGNWTSIERFGIKGIIIGLTIVILEFLSRTPLTDLMMLKWDRKMRHKR